MTQTFDVLVKDIIAKPSLKELPPIFSSKILKLSSAIHFELVLCVVKGLISFLLFSCENLGFLTS